MQSFILQYYYLHIIYIVRMLLLKSIRRYFSGSETEYIQQIMNNFVPNSEQNISKTLKQIYKTRVFALFIMIRNILLTILPFRASLSKVFKSITTKVKPSIGLPLIIIISQRQWVTVAPVLSLIQHEKYIYDNKSYQITCKRTLQQKIQKMKGYKHSYGFQKSKNLPYYRQFPLYDKLFLDAGSLYSLRLFELAEYMNSLKIIPKWQPYIRITYLLKALGHQVKLRQQLTDINTIQFVDYKYYYFLCDLFPINQYEALHVKQKTTQPFLTNIIQKLILKDQIKYDQYLQRIEKIDNLALNVQINQNLDVISWLDISYIFQLAAKSHDLEGQNQNTQHKIHSLFDRKFQTSKINLQEATSLLKVFHAHPHFLFNQKNNILSKIVETIYTLPDSEFEGIPPQIYLVLLKQTQLIPFSYESGNLLQQFLLKRLKTLVFWDQDSRQMFLDYLQAKQIKTKKDIIQYLNTVKVVL